MKRVLYFDLSYHQKTKSSLFLLEQLKQEFDVEEIYFDFSFDFQWEEMLFGNDVYDYLVCVQVMPPREWLASIRYGKGVLFPMYDAVRCWSKEKWMEYSDFVVINFSRTLHEQICEYGIVSHYIQFFPKPASSWELGRTDSLFFWQRVEEVNVDLMMKVCAGLDIKKIHIHKALDPEAIWHGVKETGNISFAYSTWFEKREDMYGTILQSAFYYAPRLYEGIGMSFLEAMAMGRCVIAPDFPTMNEYIEHGKNGYIYDYNDPKEFYVEDVVQIQKNAYDYICKGYEKWNREKNHIIDWIKNSVPNTYHGDKTKECRVIQNIFGGGQYTVLTLVKLLQAHRHLTMKDCEVSMLKEKKSILLIKSAKDNIAMPFMEYLENNCYMGSIHMIGRKGDEIYKEKFPKLLLDVYTVDSEECYSMENTQMYIQGREFDCAVFLYRTEIYPSYDNLVSIISSLSCTHYAVGIGLKIVEFEKLAERRKSLELYRQLLEWLCEHNVIFEN